MVKKNSSDDKISTNSLQEDVSAKSTQKKTRSENAVKKPRASSSGRKTKSTTAKPKTAAAGNKGTATAEKTALPKSEKSLKTEPKLSKQSSAADNNNPKPDQTSTSSKTRKSQTSTANALKQPLTDVKMKSTPSITSKSKAIAGNKKTTPVKKKNTAVKVQAESAAKKAVQSTGKAAPKATNEPGISTVTQRGGSVNSESVNTAGEVQPGAVASEASKEPVYQEPETPLGFPPPVVEEAESISPPIPEQSNLPQESHAIEQEPEQVDQHHEPPPGPQYPSMYVVQITPELAPLAKVGGLADVVTGLSRELEMRGNSVEIILPKYDCMRYDHIWGLCETYDDLWVPWYGGHIQCTVWFGFVHERKCFFIEPHSPDNFFNRGSIYGFDDDILRFAFFSRAAIEFLWKAGKHPDIIHCHDWQTALVPVFLYEIYQHMGMTHPRVCYTIHNYKHQGVTGDFLLDATGLYRPEYYFHHDRLLDNQIPHAINLMKGGVVYSNFVTTVSPKYAGETKDGGQGFGLEPTLHTHHYKYGGIVNGIDYDTWNPAIDGHIPFHYHVNNIEEKYNNKRALRERLLLADSAKPIIAFIGRLDPQKGLDLVRHALFYSLNHAAQFVLLGSSPDSDINNYFWELKRHLNDSPDCHIEVGFDEDLAHLIYAGSDMMIVPSLFEPCGLTQLIAMQYGTVPIVREVGGLADTVHDKDNAHDKPLHERNGYSFINYDNPGLESALSRAIDCYYQFPDHFRNLMINAMNYDYSWKNAGQHYLNIYDYIREK